MDAGRLFYTRGPSTAKYQSPNVVLVGGIFSLAIDYVAYVWNKNIELMNRINSMI